MNSFESIIFSLLVFTDDRGWESVGYDAPGMIDVFGFIPWQFLAESFAVVSLSGCVYGFECQSIFLIQGKPVKHVDIRVVSLFA